MEAVIVGVGRIAARRSGVTPRELARQAVDLAMADAAPLVGENPWSRVTGLFASPSFAGAAPTRAFGSPDTPMAGSPFLSAHGIATHLGLFAPGTTVFFFFFFFFLHPFFSPREVTGASQD
jgi:hypothetical protein